MFNKKFRIIIFDNNSTIHKDIIKTLAQHDPHEHYGQSATFIDARGQTQTQPTFFIDRALGSEEGVDKIRVAIQQNNPYSLAFIDIKLLTESSLDTIQQIWSLDQNIQIVICFAFTDHSHSDVLDTIEMNDNLIILKKPIDNLSIRQLACSLSKKWVLARDSRQYMETLNRLVEERTESLEQSLALLKATFESTNDGILVLDSDGRVINYNSQFLSIWGIEKSILTETNVNILESLQDKIKEPPAFLRKLNRLKKNLDTSSVQHVNLLDKSVIECSSQPYKVNTQIIGRVWIFRDITSRSNLEQRLEYKATHDSLTTLPNRILLQDRITQAILSAERQKSKFALLFFDLDRFKLVNDSLSHELGDELLKAVAKRITALKRAEDTFARFGGDEFVMIATTLNKTEDAVNVAHRVLSAFVKPFQVQRKKINLSTSIGIALYPNDGTTTRQLIRNADLAMYHAKERGGDQYRFYTNSMNQQSTKRINKERELRKAFENEEFYILYQPQFNVQQQKMLSAEVLLRWKNPKKGIILPMEFIPIAEVSGLIVPLGEWVIEKICKQYKHWQAVGLPPINLGINISIQQLRQYNFVSYLRKILHEYKFKPCHINLEITENTILIHQEVLPVIKELKEIGVNIVLDDFGTVHSSLNYLKKLKIDGLKISPSFIRNISLSESDEVIIKAIIAMAKNLGFKVIAQGVENLRQRNFLLNQQCDQLQGFHFSQPISGDKATEFFKKAANEG